MTLTFAVLHDHLAAAGVDVGLELAECGLVITLTDHARMRSVRFPVGRASIDSAAACLVLSLALHEMMLEAAGATGPAPKGVSGNWPELRVLADATGATRG